MKSDKLSLEEESQKITKLMEEGEISPDEAMKRLEALMNPVLEKVNNLESNKFEYEEDVRPFYYIDFANTHNETEAAVFEGNLYIIEFSKKRLVAHLEGTQLIYCMKDSVFNNDRNCQKPSTINPGDSVLEERKVTLTIDSTFDKFEDNRMY